MFQWSPRKRLWNRSSQSYHGQNFPIFCDQPAPIPCYMLESTNSLGIHLEICPFWHRTYDKLHWKRCNHLYHRASVNLNSKDEKNGMNKTDSFVRFFLSLFIICPDSFVSFIIPLNTAPIRYWDHGIKAVAKIRYQENIILPFCTMKYWRVLAFPSTPSLQLHRVTAIPNRETTPGDEKPIFLAATHDSAPINWSAFRMKSSIIPEWAGALTDSGRADAITVL